MQDVNNLCLSCSGPLSDFRSEEIDKHPGFCPNCVDEKGRLKTYMEILEGMIDYIKNDHPEIADEKQVPQAEKWLEEGPIWGEFWQGTIIEESLENVDILKLLEIVSTEKSINNDQDKNHGFPTWTLHKVRFTRLTLEKIIDQLSTALKAGKWWCDFSNNKEAIVVFKGKVFKGSLDDAAFKDEVNDFAKSLNLPANQLPFRN